MFSPLTRFVNFLVVTSMEPSTPSSGGVIPRSRLTNLVVFTDLEPEGEKILKSAKLAHVNDSEGFIVTMEDETYSFSYTKGESDIKITRIPELCSARVKGTSRPDCHYFKEKFFNFCTFQNFSLDQLTWL